MKSESQQQSITRLCSLSVHLALYHIYFTAAGTCTYMLVPPMSFCQKSNYCFMLLVLLKYPADTEEDHDRSEDLVSSHSKHIIRENLKDTNR